MPRPELAQRITADLNQGKVQDIKELLSGIRPSEIADILHTLDPEEYQKVLEVLDTDTVSEVLLELEPERREEILGELDAEKIADIIEEMDSDDAADLIGDLPEQTASDVLAKMDPEELKDIEPLLKYPEDSAGGIMQTELVKVTDRFTVRDTINWIRLIADEIDDFYHIFVTDEDEKLLGQISLSKLVLATPSSRVSNIMEPVEYQTTPSMDQEQVAKMFQKYGIMSLPVVDSRGVLIGRITADDVMDVVTEEASEDILQMAGVGETLHPIFTPIRSQIRLRMPWLLLTLCGELFIAFIIVSSLKPALEKLAILAAFMPAIMAVGGNVGLQTPRHGDHQYETNIQDYCLGGQGRIVFRTDLRTHSGHNRRTHESSQSRGVQTRYYNIHIHGFRHFRDIDYRGDGAARSLQAQFRPCRSFWAVPHHV
jgi:magnesium transporter